MDEDLLNIMKKTFKDVINNSFFHGVFIGTLLFKIFNLSWFFIIMCYPMWFMYELIINLIKEAKFNKVKRN